MEGRRFGLDAPCSKLHALPGHPGSLATTDPDFDVTDYHQSTLKRTGVFFCESFQNDADEIFPRVIGQTQDHDSGVSAKRIFPRIREVQVLRDEKSLFSGARLPNSLIRLSSEVFVENAMHIMPAGSQSLLQRKRQILVEFDLHAPAACRTGKSSRAEAAA